jgi:hypothetical protein
MTRMPPQRSRRVVSAGNAGVRLIMRQHSRSTASVRTRMPMDLCHTNRSTLVGERGHSSAIHPSENCVKMSAATIQCKLLATLPQLRFVLPRLIALLSRA